VKKCVCGGGEMQATLIMEAKWYVVKFWQRPGGRILEQHKVEHKRSTRGACKHIVEKMDGKNVCAC